MAVFGWLRTGIGQSHPCPAKNAVHGWGPLSFLGGGGWGNGIRRGSWEWSGDLEVWLAVADGLAWGGGERGWGGEFGGVLVEAGDGGECLIEVGLLVGGLRLGLGGGGLRAEPGFEGGYLGEGDGTSLGAGLGVDGELEEVGEDDVFDGELGLACGAGLAGGLPGGLEDGGEDFCEIG